MSNFNELTKQEKVAVCSSAFILAVGAGYWLYQIYSTVEFLRLAYGG